MKCQRVVLFQIQSMFVLTSSLVIFLNIFFPARISADNHCYNTLQSMMYASSDALDKSRDLIRKGLYSEALPILKPILNKPLQNPESVADYLSILVWEGRNAEAIQLYEKLPVSFPQFGYLTRNIAKAYYDSGNYDRAFQLYRISLKRDSVDEEARKGVILSLIHMNELEQAEGFMEGFLADLPDSVTLAVTNSYLLIMKKQYIDAFRIFLHLESREGINLEHLYKSRDDLIASLTDEQKKELVQALRDAGAEYLPSYLQVLILSKQFDNAVRAFETSGMEFKDIDHYLQSWIAWAYFKTGDIAKSKQYFNHILNEKPKYVRAVIGLAYCYAGEGNSDNALRILDRLTVEETQNTEVLFARAYAFEKKGSFWPAIKEYDRIINITRRNPVAERLRIRALSDMGASSLALEKATELFPEDRSFVQSIEEDMLADRIHWNEFANAISMVQSRLDLSQSRRGRFDYIVALVENREMNKAIDEYEALVNENIDVPEWVLERIAEAYMYLERPDDALGLYEEIIKSQPTFSSRMGKFYVLQEMRRFRDAWRLIDELDKETPEVLNVDGKVLPNWNKLEIAIARGWLLLYEQRFDEAEKYFRSLYEKAPANSDLRSGLAHTYMWRGWPRRALKEFRIISSIDPSNIGAQTGMVAAMNSLAFKKEARAELDMLLKTQPHTRHIEALKRRLKSEELRDINVNFAWSADDEGFREATSRTELSQPVSLYTRVHGFFSWQRSENDDLTNTFRRAGAGVSHVFNSSFTLSQDFSVDAKTGDDFGSLTTIEYAPDDYWSAGISFESFSTDVPLRASVFDISARKFDFDLAYQESEQRLYRLSVTYRRFSDDNERYEGILGYQQGLYSMNNLNTRLFADFYMSSNSRDDVSYFNPDHDMSFSVSSRVRQTLMQVFEKSFVHALYLSIGFYKQSGFPGDIIGSVRYEHNIDFSVVHSLSYGADVSRRVFDGERVTGYDMFLSWRRLF